MFLEFSKERVLVLLCILSLSNLVGCTPGRGKENQKVVIRFAHYEDSIGIQQLNELISDFETTNPNINVKMEQTQSAVFYNKILTQFAGGICPDVFYTDPQRYVYFASKGVIQPLDQFVEKEDSFKISDFHPNIVDAITYQGNIWVLPKGCHSFVIYYQ